MHSYASWSLAQHGSLAASKNNNRLLLAAAWRATTTTRIHRMQIDIFSSQNVS